MRIREALLAIRSASGDYLSTLRVQEIEGGKGSRMEWLGQFTPVGESEEEVSSCSKASTRTASGRSRRISTDGHAGRR